jgi:CheY-like chemotaxis protein
MDLTVRFLQLYGHDAICTSDGLQALQLALVESPALILMDATLEGSAIDGWEAVRRIKSQPETRSIPIIGFTASTATRDVERARAAGCDDFAGKPFDFAEMIGKINALLSS